MGPGRALEAVPRAQWPSPARTAPGPLACPRGQSNQSRRGINHGQGHSEHPAHTQCEKRPRGPGRRESRHPLHPSLQVVLDRTGSGGAAVWLNSGAT